MAVKENVSAAKRADWRPKTIGRPILASLLEDRRVALLLSVVGAVQLALVAIEWEGWQCPIKATLHIPCPGCGLSTAMLLLIRGKWHAAISTHAFAPIFLLGFVLMTITALLPAPFHQRVVHRTAELEGRTGVVTYVLLGLVVYWVIRLWRLL